MPGQRLAQRRPAPREPAPMPKWMACIEEVCGRRAAAKHPFATASVLMCAVLQAPLALLSLVQWRRRQTADEAAPFVAMWISAGVLVLVLIARFGWLARRPAVRGRGSRSAPEDPKALAKMTRRRQAEVRELLDGCAVASGPFADCGTCAICLQAAPGHDDLEQDTCRALACGHVFHRECIARWWVERPQAAMTCPLCRRPAAAAPVAPDDAEGRQEP